MNNKQSERMTKQAIESVRAFMSNAELRFAIAIHGGAMAQIWSNAFPIGGETDLGALRNIEAHARCLAAYCKLLADRLDAGPSAAVEHLRASLDDT